MISVILRPITEADLPACADILMSVYNNELWQCRWTKETAMAYLSDLFAARKFVGYAAQEEDRLIGAVFAHEKVWWNNSEVYVEEMFVRPECQRMSCGSRLMEQVEAYVTQNGLAGITLSTNRYAPAPEFYRKHGYAECGHVLFMAKEIS